MRRNILAAIAGYAVMAVLVIAGTGVAWLALGSAGAFDGEGPEPSTPWLALNLMSGLIAAVFGGLVARRIGGSGKAVRILLGLVVALGLVFAVVATVAAPEPEPAGKPVVEMSWAEAGQYARQPAWYNWLIPFVGAAGVLLGGRERG